MASCNHHHHPLPTNGPKVLPGHPGACSPGSGWGRAVHDHPLPTNGSRVLPGLPGACSPGSGWGRMVHHPSPARSPWSLFPRKWRGEGGPPPPPSYKWIQSPARSPWSLFPRKWVGEGGPPPLPSYKWIPVLPGLPGACSPGSGWGRVVHHLSPARSPWSLFPRKWVGEGGPRAMLSAPGQVEQQPRSRVGNYPSNKITHVPPPLLPPKKSQSCCYLCCFLFSSDQFC